MAAYKLLLLPGDGIGPEITAEAEKVLAFLRERRRCELRDGARTCGRRGL